MSPLPVKIVSNAGFGSNSAHSTGIVVGTAGLCFVSFLATAGCLVVAVAWSIGLWSHFVPAPILVLRPTHPATSCVVLACRCRDRRIDGHCGASPGACDVLVFRMGIDVLHDRHRIRK